MKKISVIITALLLLFLYSSVMVHAEGELTITSNPANSTVMEGASAVFSANAAVIGEIFPVYTWHIVVSGTDYEIHEESEDPWTSLLSGVHFNDGGKTLVLEKVTLALSGSEVYCSISAEQVEAPLVTSNASLTVTEIQVPSLIVPVKIPCYVDDSITINCTPDTEDADLLSRITYYWYASTSANKKDIIRTPITEPGNPSVPITASSYSPDTSKAGKYYYCCAAIIDAGTTREKYAISDMVTIEVDEELIPPEVTLSVSSDVTRINAPVTLTVTAKLPSSSMYDEEDLTYAWYRCADSTGSDPVLIEDKSATKSTYKLPVPSAGTFYCSCRVTVNSEGQNASKDSAPVSVTVYEPVASVTYNIPGVTLTNNASVTIEALYSFRGDTDEGLLTFQWYRSDAPGSYDCSFIPGENKKTITVKNNGESGEYFYFCEITNEPYVIGTADRIEGTYYSSYRPGMIYLPVVFESDGVPSEPPTEAPTKAPTKEPTEEPTKETEPSSSEPTKGTEESTKEPTEEPTEAPGESDAKTEAPTEEPTASEESSTQGEIDLTEAPTEQESGKRPGTNVLSFETSLPIKIAIISVVVLILVLCISYLTKRK